MKYGIIGSGRAAQHFTHYFKLLGVSTLSWSRKTASETRSRPADLLFDCDTILVLLSDSAIEPFINDELSSGSFSSKKIIHFSGCLTTPLAQGFHPLMSLGPTLFTLETYFNIPFIIEKGKYGFKDIFPKLSNPHFEISPEIKPYYHALCVMSGNFSTLLWQKFFHEIESQFSIPRAMALPYLKSIFHSLIETPDSALTGPFARNDASTIQSNLDALKKFQDPFEKIYSAFKEIYANRA